MNIPLPAKCFISHSYADTAARERLLRILPASVEPLIFPPIQARPDEFVSKPLIEAILACDGLIYLRGGASDRSFWVAFERDYALRSGKPVFCYDVGRSELSPDTGKPLDLAMFPSYHGRDRERVRQICQFLDKKRNFDVWLDVEDIRPGTLFAEEIQTGLADRLNRGGYVTVFWSDNARRSAEIEKELATAASGIEQINDRVLFALLEPCPLPEFWLRFREPSVQLYGDSERSANHRIDDLMVRLYWLIYRKTKSSEATHSPSLKRTTGGKYAP
jgi:TIR domain